MGGVRANFRPADIRKKFEQALKQIDDRTVKLLIKLGNECLVIARDNGNYTDRTGNLRSSTGFVVVLNGRIVAEQFSTANLDENGKGESTGRAFAEQVAKKYGKGYALIVVAGMAYAAAVESKGKDVLTSAEMYAKKKLPKLLENLKKAIDKKYS